MTKERPQQPLLEGFQFTENEKLFGWISEERFQAYLSDSQTTIHKLEISSNNYGEFLFGTLSRPSLQTETSEIYTFWGLGLHEYRDRYFTDEWWMYRSNAYPDLMKQNLTLEEVQQILQERKDEIEHLANTHIRSEQGKMFAMLADMSDDDGAIADLEDFPNLFDDWL